MTGHIGAILWKQLKDTLKNKTILIQFIMFPVLTLVMENTIELQEMPDHFFANLFAIMYVGMAPLTSMSAIISEEKEKNTLHVLQMCNVKFYEYLLGNGIYVITICMLGSLVIGMAGGYRGAQLGGFLLIMFLGQSISVLLGATVGILSKNQMAATAVTVPVMMVLAFLPMLSMFNETISKVAKFVFSSQLHMLLIDLGNINIGRETIGVLVCNTVLVLTMFVVAYGKLLQSK